ncbi:DUF58 domain-containing protein [Alkalimarinus coralli]|uniref:DUF58 domain-containing protein n=1 Tax=Alkalimarinus coralli TaxID=2935863 RepID=UPI00202B65F4|nr:DUF58 domain-containing protein [Alkalimarinus coralli]
MSSNIKKWWRTKFFQWIARRSPPSDMKVLTHKNVYIFPTKEGGLYACLLALLLLTAINYQSSLIYLFVFFLGALFILSIILCFKNLSGLQVSLVKASENFANEDSFYTFTLKTKPSQYCESLGFVVPGQPTKKVDVSAAEVASLVLSKLSEHRGLVSLGRIKIETVYPLGLIRAWTWLEFETCALNFPIPNEGIRAPSDAVQGDETDAGIHCKGEDELAGLRDYVVGDAPSRIAWKHYAAKGELYVKEFDGLTSSTRWLNYKDYVSGDKEQRLSYLCHDVLSYSSKGQSFGMVFPGGVIEPSQGDEHKMSCLRALALVP